MQQCGVVFVLAIIIIIASLLRFDNPVGDGGKEVFRSQGFRWRPFCPARCVVLACCTTSLGERITGTRGEWPRDLLNNLLMREHLLFSPITVGLIYRLSGGGGCCLVTRLDEFFSSRRPLDIFVRKLILSRREAVADGEGQTNGALRLAGTRISVNESFSGNPAKIGVPLFAALGYCVLFVRRNIVS